MNKRQQRIVARIVITILGVVALHIASLPAMANLALYLVLYLIIGYDIIKKAVLGIAHGSVFDENFLMAIATVGAFVLAVYERSGDYLEAIAVMLFYQIGELFQSYAVGKSRKSITSLMDIRPDYANIERDGKIEKVSPDDVAVGSIIIIQPGEKIPIDCIIDEGTSTLDTSALTGESRPRNVGPDDTILSGSINLSGVLKAHTIKEFDDSTASKILELVEDSAMHKARSENFITRFARVYTPSVCASALLLAIIPPLIQIAAYGYPMNFTTFETWVYRALTFLVISCPCALVISIPLTFFAGIGCASRQGILVKGANILETLSKVKTVVFDKTGTLTKGVFQVIGVHDGSDNNADGEMLRMAATIESTSTHPIAQSIIKAYGKGIDRSLISDIHEISGQGIVANYKNATVAIGNKKLMDSTGVTTVPCSSAGTIVHIAIDNQYSGHIVLGDVLKPTSREAITDLRRIGVKNIVMLTGDSSDIARQVAKAIGVDAVYSDMLPVYKVKKVEQLINQEGKGEKLAFVGDGINDAPVLTRADVGIAMGAIGSDAAIEAADVVLMDDNPEKVCNAIRTSRNCLAIVWQNILFALGIKGICLVLGLFGIINMWLAIFADVGVMVLAVLNAMRAMIAPR
ncbi:MAG: cadmium-translocating P-type ATPase [Muribaculum sp.]|nr:cadmium-translocating P-type ATPase [Muribaculaceae bacterium]MCM1080573.1 cadmium-translocating P-type ATPase [Muribaculum sp.]